MVIKTKNVSSMCETEKYRFAGKLKTMRNGGIRFAKIRIYFEIRNSELFPCGRVIEILDNLD